MFKEIYSQCLKCKNARCANNCPVKTPIPEIISLVEAGDIDAAALKLFLNNPLSAVCSVVCPHENNCYGNCVRGIKGESVAFYKIEQKISRDFLENFKVPPIEKNNHKVAIIGAGPAGITASILLSLKGFRVTLMDAKEEIGGVLRYGIPDFRLPKEIVDTYQIILKKLGVVFKPNIFVGSTLVLDDMLHDGYEAIFVAVGTAKPNRLGLLGETLGNVHFAIDYLKCPSSYEIGKEVVVIGAGNVALDAARMATRYIPKGGRVTILNNRREMDMTGNIHEIEDAVNEGVQFRHLLQTVKISEEYIQCVEVEPIENNGTIAYEEIFEKPVKVEADTVIIAIGQGPQGAVVSDTTVEKTKRGLLDVDENGMTSMSGIFAAGDIVSGPRTVVEAVAFSKKAVEQIEQYIFNKH
ncbi:MAG: FAD-dependent oxidoreductase [Clostridia bacterium]